MPAKGSRGSRRPAPPGPEAKAAIPTRSGTPATAAALLEVAVLAVAAWHLVALWHEATPALLANDECFHAYLAEWIAAHGSLPRTLPEFYSGLPYFYPPLLHVLGAVAIKLAGPGALKYLNVVLTGVMLLVLRALPIPGVPAAARRVAVLACTLTPVLSLFAVRFYAEALATALAVLFVALLLRMRALEGAGTIRDAVVLGLVVGAALLAK